jgi:oligopeptide transport system substrate-binding protein
VTYSFNTDADHAKVAEMLQAAWRRVLNIDVRLENQEWQVYLDNHRNGNFQFGRASWIGDYVDPMTFLSIWLSYDTSNRNGYANAEYDHLVEEAQRTQDRQRYFELCHEAERVLMDDMALIPIYYYANTFLQNPALDGLIYTALGTPLFHHARWNVDMIRAAEEAG